MVLANEVYTGAGLSATMIPEMDQVLTGISGDAALDFIVGVGTVGQYEVDRKTITWTAADDAQLVPDVYRGCLADIKVFEADGTTPSDDGTGGVYLISGNDQLTVTFGQQLSSEATDTIKCKILAYGAPLFAPATSSTYPSLMSDNWLGLVNTITPPTVDAELKQVNLALGGTRNFGHQFKGAETLGEASFDVSLNNGSWLYYALGSMTFTAPQLTGEDLSTKPDLGTIYSLGGDVGGATKFYRSLDANRTVYPPKEEGHEHVSMNELYEVYDTTKVIDYIFTESNSGDLPSFALEITTEKGNASPYRQDALTENLFSRIFTGCQVNTLTMNFEEGQDVKATIGAVSRAAVDTNTDYVPRRNVTTPTELFNYSSADADVNPFMFSDGLISIYGQTMARVKSGTLTISNNLMPQRFIGNYDRKVTSAYIAGQRTYELSLNLLITDSSIWNELREQNETNNSVDENGLIELTFDKTVGAAGVTTTDKIIMKFDDYLTTSVDMPFPDDKAALEVAMTVQARTLNTCTYTGKWVIQG